MGGFTCTAFFDSLKKLKFRHERGQALNILSKKRESYHFVPQLFSTPAETDYISSMVCILTRFPIPISTCITVGPLPSIPAIEETDVKLGATVVACLPYF